MQPGSEVAVPRTGGRVNLSPPVLDQSLPRYGRRSADATTWLV